MGVAYNALFVDDQLGRHAAEFDDVYFLSIFSQNSKGWIGEACKWQIIFLPIVKKCLCVITPDHDDLSFMLYKFFMILTQLRHMPLAKVSKQPTIENQEDILLSLKICKADYTAFDICQ